VRDYRAFELRDARVGGEVRIEAFGQCGPHDDAGQRDDALARDAGDDEIELHECPFG